LDRGLSGAKTLVFSGWKSLDFLGFSRPKRAFSMGYARFSLKNFSLAPCLAATALERRPWRLRTCGWAELLIGQVYPNFCFSSIERCLTENVSQTI
jgi:hypothetical protein